MGAHKDTLERACSQAGVKFVGGRGDSRQRVWLIGEVPGAEEDAAGLPFVGPSGQEQDRMLTDAGFAPGEVYFTNVYKTRPPDNDLAKLAELGVPLDLYAKALLEELEESRPPIIVTAGGTSTAALLPQRLSKRSESIGISHLRGSLLRSPLLAWEHYVIPVQHPAFVLREWTERQISVFCYARALEELRYWRQHATLQPLPIRSLLTLPSFDVAMAFLEDVTLSASAITLDLEMTPSRSTAFRWKTVFLIGIARSAYDAVSLLPWDYPTAQARALLRKLDVCLRSNVVVGHNAFNFDFCWLDTIGLPTNIGFAEDTLTMHHVLYPELPHKLEFLTMQFTREPFYKNEGRGINVNSAADMQRYSRYNAMDAAVTYECWQAMKRELDATV